MITNRAIAILGPTIMKNKAKKIMYRKLKGHLKAELRSALINFTPANAMDTPVERKKPKRDIPTLAANGIEGARALRVQ